MVLFQGVDGIVMLVSVYLETVDTCKQWDNAQGMEVLYKGVPAPNAHAGATVPDQLLT